MAQGDPLSPLIFNVITHKVCHGLQNVLVSQYADDFVLFVINKDIKKCEQYVQTALYTVVNLLDELGLSLSVNKTNFCVFSRGRRRIMPTIKIYGQELTSTECVKYLGLWLDRSLLWRKHVNEVIDKCSKFMNILKMLAGRSWGMHTKHIRRLYIALIRSRIDYGSFLYDCSANCHVSKLDKLQNQALRVIGGFIKSTPIHVMQSELSLPPLFIRRLYLAYKYMLNAYRLPTA